MVGVGGVLAAVSPELLLPPARPLIAQPNRTYFLPPVGGWLQPFKNGDYCVSAAGGIYKYLGGVWVPINTVSVPYLGKRGFGEVRIPVHNGYGSVEFDQDLVEDSGFHFANAVLNQNTRRFEIIAG